MSPFAFTSMSMPITSVVGGDFILVNPDSGTREGRGKLAAYVHRGEGFRWPKTNRTLATRPGNVVGCRAEHGCAVMLQGYTGGQLTSWRAKGGGLYDAHDECRRGCNDGHGLCSRAVLCDPGSRRSAGNARIAIECGRIWRIPRDRRDATHWLALSKFYGDDTES